MKSEEWSHFLFKVDNKVAISAQKDDQYFWYLYMELLFVLYARHVVYWEFGTTSYRIY